MSFYDRFEFLCQVKGVTPTQAARENDITQSVVAMWKKRGSTPKAETVQKLADYFGVTPRELTGIDNSKIISAYEDIRHKEIIITDLRYQLEHGYATEDTIKTLLKLIERRPLIDIPSDLNPDEVQRLIDEISQIANEASATVLVAMKQFRQSMAELNDTGKQKVIKYADEYAHDLAKIPEYQREQPTPTPQSPVATSGNADPTLPPDGSEGPSEGE